MSEQLSLKLKRIPQGRGGWRPGAGRPRNKNRVSHARRPAIASRFPVHVTLRVAPGVPSLRRKDIFHALRRAVAVARGAGLGIVHFSLLSNHLHLLVEPGSLPALSRAMQSFEISFARRLNRVAGRKGATFADRYHLNVLKSPTETRNALAYVLANESRHRGLGRGTFIINPYSSGFAFDHWRALFGRSYDGFAATDWSVAGLERLMAELLRPPRTWLLREGWRKGRVRPDSSKPEA
jgi:REP element-mobilizing transposase RayT